jgi:hypothetical protein
MSAREARRIRSAELFWTSAAEAKQLGWEIACGKPEAKLSLPYGESRRLSVASTCDTNITHKPNGKSARKNNFALYAV